MKNTIAKITMMKIIKGVILMVSCIQKNNKKKKQKIQKNPIHLFKVMVFGLKKDVIFGCFEIQPKSYIVKTINI